MWISQINKEAFVYVCPICYFGACLCWKRNSLCIWNSNLTRYPALYVATSMLILPHPGDKVEVPQPLMFGISGLRSALIKTVESLQLCEVLLWLLGNRYFRDISPIFSSLKITHLPTYTRAGSGSPAHVILLPGKHWLPHVWASAQLRWNLSGPDPGQILSYEWIRTWMLLS